MRAVSALLTILIIISHLGDLSFGFLDLCLSRRVWVLAVSHLLCDEFGDLSFVLQVLRGVYFIACFWCNDLDGISIKSLERSLFQNKLRDTDFWLSNMMYLQSIHWYDVVYYAYIRSFTALYLDTCHKYCYVVCM